MAKREQFSTYVTCPACDKKGTASWEENENPVHGRGYDRELIDVSIGFHLAKGQLDKSGDPKIDCDNCFPNSK